MDRRRLALWGLLAVSLVAAVYYSPLTRRSVDTRRAAVPPSPQAPAPVGAIVATVEVPRLPEAELAAWRQRHGEAWQRDPFFTAEEEAALRAPKVAAPVPPPLPVAEPALPSYTLKMVLIAGTSKVASLDSRLVSEGDMVGEERVAEIQPNAVVLELGGRRRRVEVAGGSAAVVEVGSPAAEGAGRR